MLIQIGFACVDIKKANLPSNYFGYGYIAPELYKSWSNATQKSDVFSFGM